MMKATLNQAVIETSVFWDIKTYPVPPGCDAGVVGPCIKRYLKKLGYSGPFTIIAVGPLIDVPGDVLRALSSTGIVLSLVSLGSIGILGTIYKWFDSNPPPANMMIISSDPSIFPEFQQFPYYNIFELFPYASPNPESLWNHFLLDGAPKCSGTDESASWFCSVCEIHGKGFENFTTHLSTPEHKEEATQMDKETVAVTLVLWDIKNCPVPLGCNARRVAPCIKQTLKDLGYSGPLTIIAIGQLKDYPDDILQTVSSTGIVLNQYDAFNSVDSMRVINPWTNLNSPPANIMFICPYSKDFTYVVAHLRYGLGYNIIEPFPYGSPYSESLWQSFLVQDLGTLEEDECSGTDESAYWFCSVCDIHGKGFENFTTHLSTPEHKEEATQMDKEPVAVTSVLWDIKNCPVPLGCNARRVAPCIKQTLKDLGYSGPLTISAIGQLKDVPDDVLQAVSSTGIVLNQYDVFNSRHILAYLYQWSCVYRPPANILVLFPYSENLPKVLGDLQEMGYNIINPFPYDSSDSKSLWENILLQVSGTLEEDECSESGEHASWVCSVCSKFGKGFENFTMHLSRQVHKQKMPLYQSDDEKHEESVEAGVEASSDSHPNNATTMVKMQQKRNPKKKKNKRRSHWK